MFANAISPQHPEGWSTWLAGLILCLAVLSGCVGTRPGVDLPDISTWELRQQVLSELKDWEFRGRIAVKTGDEGFNGRFNWRQSGSHFHATVSGPLGIGTVLIEGSDGEIVVTDKDGTRTALVDPEQELYYRYGWTIPVASLRYWALGIPDPAMQAVTKVDEAGMLRDLEQSNWSVKISRYRESRGQPMPRTLTASNPDSRVRMVIDKWLFFDR